MLGYQAGAGRHLTVEVQFGIAAAVETDSGPHYPVHQVKADQLGVGHAAADHELVPLGDVADVLDLVLVLIGPEGVEVVVRRRGAEHGPGRGGALLLRVVEVLDPDPPEQRVEKVRHVTGRVDVGRTGPAQLVGQDPVLLRDREAVRTSGTMPMPATAKSHAIRWPAAVTTASMRSVPSKAVTCFAGPQFDAVRAVERADQRADLAAQDRLERDLAREDGGHMDSELGQRGRHLAADEPRAHHDRAPPRHRLPLDRVALGHRAQVVNPGQVSPGHPEPPVASSGRDQQPSGSRVLHPSPG